MVFCTYCGQPFTGDEHLKKHILTHTSVKPFMCSTCYMSFSRRGLLQRHYAVHGRNQNNEEGFQPQRTITNSASRTPIACSNCAKTKMKCDKKFPCSRCAQKNLKCTLRPTRRASKNATRAGIQVEGAGSGSSSDNDGNMGIQNVSRRTSTHREGQIQLATTQSPFPQQYQQPQPPQQLQNSQSPSQRHPQSPSAPRSCDSSESQPAQLLQSPIPEDKSLHMTLSSAPSFFDYLRMNGLPQAFPSMLSPPPTPAHGVNSLVSSTQIPGYDEFVRTVRDHSDSDSSPPFLIDLWDTMPMGAGFDSMMIDPASIMSIDTDLRTGSHEHGILGMIPDTSPSQGYGLIQTPLQTPLIGESSLDLQIGSSASMFYPSDRLSSIADAGISHLDAITTA